ncbi:MAG TPA: LptE family protein [Tepidisphaeraceae bacterium]|nr:LptE family protein [Tepidisphaeraceae bacterium]
MRKGPEAAPEGADLPGSVRNLISTFRCSFQSALVVGLLLGASGCGYQMGVGGDGGPSLYREDVRTVAIPIFKSESFSRNDEFELTQALVAQIESRTPYKVVPRERADTILEGTITRTSTSTVSRDDETNLPQEQLYTMRIDFTWKDLRSGKILVDRKNFEQTNTFYPTLGEGTYIGKQSVAESLASSIVNELQRDW